MRLPVDCMLTEDHVGSSSDSDSSDSAARTLSGDGKRGCPADRALDRGRSQNNVRRVSRPENQSSTGPAAPRHAAPPEETPSVFFDAASNNARAAIDEGRFRVVEEPHDADLLWMRKGYRDWFEQLRPFQLLNHLPNENAVTDKGFLAEHLKQFDRVQTAFDFGMKDLVQETYCLYIPDEATRFFGQLPLADSKDNLWILKPCTSSRGRGIRILWQFDELRKAFAYPATYDFDPQKDRYVIQRYIKNPLLLQGRKSEIRIYWLVASLDPLLVLMYREGTVRLNTMPFSLDDFDNTLVHVTNVFQQKSHPDYDPSVVLKWSFSDWENYLIRDLKLAPENYVEGHLKPQLKRMLSFVIRAAVPSLEHQPATGLFFGLLGADIIFDDKLHPWLTEIQKGPGLSFDDAIKKKVIPPMLNEAVAIMLEVRRRKRDGLSLKELDAVRRFEWVIRQG